MYVPYTTSVLSVSHPTPQIVAQLLSFPLGRLWAWLMPRVKIFGIPLNPGPFSMKEHVLITVMATVGYQSAYAVCATVAIAFRAS